jgi:tetratricopeptide (TPR) repeat protein
LLWRIASSLRNRSEEAAWWIGAATAFGPISQIFPFFYGMADRYLYFILPGLLGGVFLASKDLLAGRVADENAGNSIRRRALLIPRAALVGGVLLSLLFAFQAQTRVLLWRSMDNLDRDAVSHYPGGSGALFFEATMAVEQGDYDRAIELLRGAAERGHFFVQPFRVDLFDPLFEDPRFQDLLYEIEGRRIAFARERGFRTQRQLMNVAESHELRGEYDESIALLERAIRKGGPLHEKLLERLVRVHQKRGGDRLPSTE